MRKAFQTFISIGLFVFGFPGYVDGAKTWSGWLSPMFENWEFMNYTLVSVGLAGLIWTWWPELSKVIGNSEKGDSWKYIKNKASVWWMNCMDEPSLTGRFFNVLFGLFMVPMTILFAFALLGMMVLSWVLIYKIIVFVFTGEGF